MRYDAVIIGSGLGGLETAYILAKEGMNVCVLEKNRQVGGSLQIFSRDKAIFDTGVHYIGGLEKGQNLHTYFNYLGLMDKLRLRQMDKEGFDRVTFEGNPQVFSMAQGYERFVEGLAQQFPAERQSLNRYVEKIKEVCNAFPLYVVKDANKDFVDTWFLEQDAKSVINSIVSDPLLQKVLAGNNVLYAGLGDKTPFYVHALVVNTYIESAFRCEDGASQIAKILSDNIRAMGGTIMNYSEAMRFHFSGDLISSVELTDGRIIEGKNFISGMDFSKTLDMVDGSYLRSAFKNRIHGLENTISSFLLHIVLEPEAMPYMNYNLYHFNTDDVWNTINYTESTWPPVIGLFPGASSRSPEHTESLTAMTYMHYSECEAWKDTYATIPHHKVSRGESYEEFKQRKAEILLAEVERQLPGFGRRIKSYTCATPLTYRDYIGSRDGTMYGILKDYKAPMRSFITPRTKIKNLLLTGQNLNMHGVLGVTVSAVVTCSELLGHPYLIRKIIAST